MMEWKEIEWYVDLGFILIECNYIRSGASCTQIKPKQILFHICEQLLVSWGKCRVLNQLERETKQSQTEGVTYHL